VEIALNLVAALLAVLLPRSSESPDAGAYGLLAPVRKKSRDS
jgi:hypothetical protein